MNVSRLFEQSQFFTNMVSLRVGLIDDDDNFLMLPDFRLIDGAFKNANGSRPKSGHIQKY